MKNIYRIIFWGIIMLICIGLGVTGVVRNNLLFSSKKTELNYIVDTFNNNSLLKTYRLSDVIVSAKLKGKDLVITYDTGAKTNYKFISYEDYIETTYKKNDAFASVMVKLVADSISQYYGNAPQVSYKAFESSTALMEYTLNDGILYIDNASSDTYTVRLNLLKPITIKYEENNNTNHVENNDNTVESKNNEVTEENNQTSEDITNDENNNSSTTDNNLNDTSDVTNTQPQSRWNRNTNN